MVVAASLRLPSSLRGKIVGVGFHILEMSSYIQAYRHGKLFARAWLVPRQVLAQAMGYDQATTSMRECYGKKLAV
jgi:hypothetical protein